MRDASEGRFLYPLAHLYGLQTSYYDMSRARQPAPVDSLLAMLKALGAPILTLRDISSAWRERRQRLWQRPLEPVIVAWDGVPSPIELRLSAGLADLPVIWYLKLESGEELGGRWLAVDTPVTAGAEIEGARYVVRQCGLPGLLPPGYHRLTLEIDGTRHEALIISAPLKCHRPQAEMADRRWGVFVPLYALHRDQDLGAGSFSDLEVIVEWVGGVGGQVVATLPLLATLPDSGEPSPYLPASRLLWNEFYLDMRRIPELEACPSARALLESSLFQQEIGAMRRSSLVDYQQQMALKRRLLAELSRCFFAEASRGHDALQRFVSTNPVVADYARFRATVEKQGIAWRAWPSPLRDGVLKTADYDEENQHYHLYVQWLAHRQIQDVVKKTEERSQQLYFDLPIGVHPDGYDVWREREIFVADTSAGAPPDTLFIRGQDWRFPPLHPEQIREQGYRYFIAGLRHQLSCARILRIDHVMGLHRIFCIPEGMAASQGVYLRYRPDEFYAVLSLESHRHQAVILGEDLGTVPRYVKLAMRRHGLYRMYVLPYEMSTNPRKSLPVVPAEAVASLNTHDMPPFAAFWSGKDIDGWLEMGLLNMAEAQKERKNRREMIREVADFLKGKGWLKGAVGDALAALRAGLSFLAGSRAWLCLINLEDLWLETEPQNIPGTREEYPNWRRKSRYSFEEFCQMPAVLDTLHMVNRRRKPNGRVNDTEKST